ncbi:hypothetical protein SORBI_3009G198350 [Sorghum bicolor]|uniref:Uncharacterized protein n=1 Tax=Sorghum bicolor TaxID=4558 RepID=A0A1Z5R4E5_SORBI|nr:hypothetical protein SORBI_3009G198350 [Sorghum bicolor]
MGGERPRERRLLRKVCASVGWRGRGGSRSLTLYRAARQYQRPCICNTTVLYQLITGSGRRYDRVGAGVLLAWERGCRRREEGHSRRLRRTERGRAVSDWDEKLGREARERR